MAIDFKFMWIWPYQHVDSAVFVLFTKFRSNVCYSHWDRRTYASDHLMTSRELTSGFDFGSVVISAWPWCIYQYNLIQDIFLQSKVIDFFRNSRWRLPPSWIFSLCEFGHSGVLIVWYLFSVPNLVQISVSHWDQRTYASDLHLMTSREFTSGFEFWSRGHLRMAVVHLTI